MQQTNSASNIAAAGDSHAAATSDDLNHSNSNQDFAAAGDNHSSIKERLGNPKITFVLGKFTNPHLNTLLTFNGETCLGSSHLAIEKLYINGCACVFFRWTRLGEGYLVRETR